ncbi:biotin/lipoate--protein ligase family protein [uncultured Tateyamaria sp.]|uniref:biotin/lipoate--protein ligase family protein n=1 Tax=uncultured Tateyamaria sp. TaxID=455651 RepID=UPI002619A18B|nr:biotin/lipoate--protein ligase family protein [uncultured Tateyamaria sp.]
MSDGSQVTFPPLMWGEEAPDGAFDHAVMRATLGCDAGLISYKLGATEMEAALVFAPEVPLSKAIAMLPLCGVGFQNALGALAPPEVAVHLDWWGGIRVNGARCGKFRAMASGTEPTTVPDWLVVGFTLPLIPASEDTGLTPDETALFAEGCAEVSPPTLLESWSRHTLNWLNRWEDEGSASLHSEWRGLAEGIGEEAKNQSLTGTFLGVDEEFGMLLRDADTTHLIPLTTVLEDPS